MLDLGNKFMWVVVEVCGDGWWWWCVNLFYCSPFGSNQAIGLGLRLGQSRTKVLISLAKATL